MRSPHADLRTPDDLDGTMKSVGSRFCLSVPDHSWVAAFESLVELEVLVWDVEQPQPDDVIDLVLLPYGAVIEPLRSFDTSRIRVIQSQALGFDGVAEALPPGSVYANAVGVHEENTAELALALVLACQRRLDEFARQQLDGGWDRLWAFGLVDRRVVVLGAGGIGNEVVRRLAGFGCEIVQVARQPRAGADAVIHGVDELPELLPNADVVILALPLTPSTEELVDDAFLSLLPDQSLIVNVSRGRIVETDAVLRQEGRIRYATDVVDIEPVPPNHPLRFAPGVFLTPHVGGRSLAQRPRVERLVIRQIRRMQAGLEPDNVVLRT